MLYIERNVYYQQVLLILEKYKNASDIFETTANRLDSIEKLRIQASEEKDKLIAEQQRVIAELLDQKQQRDFGSNAN